MGPIECTCLVTRIISNMGILDGNVPFIDGPRALIDEAYLVQGHTLKKGPDDSLVFFSRGYANEIPLPHAGYHLYKCRSLTTPLVPQEESCRQSVSGLPGRVTRSRTRGEGLQQPQPQPPQQHEASGSLWQSASSNGWAQQTQGHQSTTSSFSGPPISARGTTSSKGTVLLPLLSSWAS